MASEFVPFDEVVQELQVASDQLKKLISSGAIRAFSDGGTFKFRRKDLDKYKARRQSEPTIVIPDKMEVVDAVKGPVSGNEPDGVDELLSAPPEAPESPLRIEIPDEAPAPRKPAARKPEPAASLEEELTLEPAAASGEAPHIEIPDELPDELAAPPEGEGPVTDRTGVLPNAAAAEGGIPELTLEDLEPSSEPAQQGPAGRAAPPASKTAATDELSLDDLLDLGGLGGEAPPATPAATQEVSLESSDQEVISIDTGGLDLAPDAGDPSVTSPLELDDEAAGTGATVSLDVGGESPFAVQGEASDEADKPDEFQAASAGPITALEQRAEGTPLWAALVAATTLILLFASLTIVGAFQDHTPGYLQGVKSWLGGVR